MLSRTVAEWMSAPVVVIPPTMSLADAQRLMEAQRIRRLPVVQHEQLIGIVTWGDIRAAQPSAATTLSVYEWRTLLERATVAECMTRNPITVEPETSVLEAARLMLTHKISGLPIVSKGRLVGIITESDLFRLLMTESLGAEQADPRRIRVVCAHCGMVMRGRSLEHIGPDDQCWRCHYHLHRCDNCRYFDGIGCLLGRDDLYTAIPGQHCAAFAYRTAHVAASAR